MKTPSETTSGLLLLAGTAAAMVLAHSPWQGLITQTLHMHIGGLSFSHWINDGLMSLFFLLIGIEIRHELEKGRENLPHMAMPLLAAAGGFITPALLFLAFTYGQENLSRGWSIPAATDIAFALALLSTQKSKLPSSIRPFLLTLATADDLMAILAIALFYNQGVNFWPLGAGALFILAMSIAKRQNQTHPLFYMLAGLGLWAACLKGGIHPTLAGVITGLLLPLPVAHKAENTIAPWVYWLILPLFAFSNMGLNLTGISTSTLLSPLPWAIGLGLALGKPLGVIGSMFLAHHTFKLPYPRGSTWKNRWGMACACGIGFTMSLFIGALAFPETLQPTVRLGVLAGSLLSATTALLLLTTKKALPQTP